MHKTRFLATVVGLLLGTGMTACGGNDDESSDEDGNGGSGGSGNPTPMLGTCDLRSVSSSCIELHEASAIDMENQENGCLNANGGWSNDVCPTEELVGCCEYTFGNDFRECFYVGVTRDPVVYCADFEGVWTPAT